ncbi:pyridoxamine 5'-phosphate oxidase family protein [Leptolyngbyaceae cyanobacterium CCMR0082]|uniref:Pyridoxamine 5'-phosphate oxidase family protein n=1 Tax=Adonisia turfae CCMR0082 TaxID=2304604 RepID=A0A6M0S460_9CYAN|nr:pyridoxamine 5'-phosphate oxidase family protein [Adonisia turfae]MDV3350467.1 pyridoxamine 5'-phosphate oxidase family protein [Leptothoe sp. LEGE 181152]NEZ63319.1 pyridoxamine 5'-phosphate oxidase family protein [Adonisia turfae CCMR0082]
MKTTRTQVKRIPKRGHYDLKTVYSILDAGLICHVGFAVDDQPFVIPTAYGRMDNRLFIHGSPASRMLRSLQQGIEICVTVTLLDGLVLARSAMHHSMNYRSVVLCGTAELVSEREEKMQALYALTEHVMPGRWAETREPNEQELTATTVLALPIDEASAKIRTGPPVDDAADYGLPHWAGIIPLRMQAGEPIVDPKLAEGIVMPAHVKQYLRKRREFLEVV